MTSRDQRDKEGQTEPAIRSSVLWSLLGAALVCIAGAIWLRNHITERPVTSPHSEPLAARDLPTVSSRPLRPAQAVLPSSMQRAAHRATARSKASEVAIGISNDLREAREQVAKLKTETGYGEQHPEVREQLAIIESLEQSAAFPPEFASLVRARAWLARLRVRFGESHADVQAQLRVIESLEQSAAAGEPAELAEVKAELQRLRVRFSDEHPAVKAQVQKIAQLQEQR